MHMRWATDGPTAQSSQGSRTRDFGPHRRSALHTPCPQGIAFRGLQQPGPPRPRCRELSAQHRGHDITSACRAFPRHSHHTRGIYHVGSFHNAPPSGTYFQVRCHSHPQCVEAFRARQTSRCPQEICRAPRLTQSATAIVFKALAVDTGPTGRALPNALSQSAPGQPFGAAHTMPTGLARPPFRAHIPSQGASHKSASFRETTSRVPPERHPGSGPCVVTHGDASKASTS